MRRWGNLLDDFTASREEGHDPLGQVGGEQVDLGELWGCATETGGVTCFGRPATATSRWCRGRTASLGSHRRPGGSSSPRRATPCR